MTDELKKGPALKGFKAKTNIKTDDGYNETWDIASNVPGAKKPATPLESIVTTVGAMSRYAAMYANAGGAAILQAIESTTVAWKWKAKNGYESGPDPRQEALEKLADELGYVVFKAPEGAGRGHLDEAMKQDAQETRDCLDYKATWSRRWQEICSNDDGTLNLDAVQRELSDYTNLMGFYSKVLSHVTGGRVSYLTTWPSVVCAIADERVNEICADETSDLQKQLDEK
jgi:hypothetical protein